MSDIRWDVEVRVYNSDLSANNHYIVTARLGHLSTIMWCGYSQIQECIARARLALHNDYVSECRG